MANKKITYTLELDAEISSLESKLKGAKSALDGVLKSGGAPAGLKKSLESLEDMFGRLRDKASTPLETVGDAGKVKKDITAVMQALNGLNRIIEDLHNVSGDDRFKLLPPDIVQKLTAAISGIKTFEDSLKAATTETAALTKAREDLANATTGLAQKEADLQAKQGKLKENTDRRDQIKQEIAAIEERKRALEEAKKEQAKIDAFYSTPNADGTKKDRRQKYDGVSSTPAQAKKKTDSLAKQVAADKGTLQNLSDELKIVNKDIESYSGQVATARRRADEAKTSLEGLNAKVESLNQAFETDSAKKQQEAYDELRKTAAEAGLKMDDFSESFSPEEANKIVDALKKLKNDAMDGVTGGAKAATAAMDGFGDEAEELRRKTDAATESINEQNEALRESEAFENRIKQFLGLSGAAQVMRAALRDAMHTITELDATMTEMAVVTDLTVGDYWNQLPEYSQQASELGVSINSAYKAATLYYQQGLKGNEVTKISAETLKLAKIAGIDAADATNKMTAALRGFNMELNETSAQRVSDVYSELAAITAADVDEISNAMTKTASIAHSAGMEFETTAAFLSQIIETTRESAETAGTAMKTVIARFQELKKDPAEIGEVDGEIVDANKIETALRSVGVALRDSSGQFRALDDVFLELSSKWDGLDKNTQRYIATIAAGSRQQSRFIAMMSDYGRTQELVTSANNSAGASNKQFEKTMDSLEAKMEKLKNAWHEFTMGIMESDLVKFGVDILTKFLEIVNKSTSAFNSFGGSLVKIVSIFGIFKLGAKIFEKIKQPLISFFADVVKMSREEGEKAGKAFDKGARKGATENTEKNENQITDEELQNYNPTSFKDKAGNFIKDKTGVKEIGSGWSAIYGKDSKEQGGLRDSQANLAKLKQEGGDRKTRLSNLKTAQTIRDARAKNLGENNSLTKEADKEVDEAKKSLLEYDKAQKKVFEESKKGWDQISKGLTKMGETAMAAGVGISMLGGLLQSMGFEEIGEGVSEFGNIVTMAGTAVVTIIPIIKALSAALVTGGVSAQAAWWWAILIVAAVAALVIGIVAIVKAINNSTPEGKLKKAEEAAKKASEAADQAADSYENLKDSLDGLDEQYKTLEKLTQGTKEWNEAILEINNSVLDLIEKYPELAQYVKPQNGYLSLNINSDEVQKVIKSAQASALLSKNASVLANSNVSFAESQVAKKNYGLKGDRIDELSKYVASGEIIIKDGAFTSGTKTIESLGYTTEQLEKLYKQNSSNIELLREYGNLLLSAEAQKKAGFSSMALSAQQMANTEGFTNEMLSISSNIIQESTASQIYEKELSKISTINYTDDINLKDYQRQERDAAVKQVYGQDVKIEELTNEEIQSAIVQTKVVTDMVDSIKSIPIMLSTFAEQNSTETTKMLNNLLQDWEGGEMSMSDYNHLAKMSIEQLKKIYKDLGTNAKKIFGSEEAFLAKIEDTKKILNNQNKAMKTSVEAMFGKDAKIPNWNIPPEIGSQLLLKFQEVFNKADSSTFKTFYDQFDTILSRLTEDEQRIFSSIFESMDWSNTADLATLPDKLNQAGINLQEFGIDLYDFIDNVAEASHAIAKLSAEELSKVLGDVSDLINDINKGEQGRVVSEEQYKSLLYADPTLQKEFAKVSDGYMYLGNSMDDLAQAVIDNTKTLKGEDSETANKAIAVFDAIDTVTTEHNTKMSGYNSYVGYSTEITDIDAEIAKREARIDQIGDPDPDSFLNYIADSIYWANGGMFVENAPSAVARELLSEKQRLEKEVSELKSKREGKIQDQNLVSGYTQYSGYQAVTAENIGNLTRQQLIDFLTSLDAKSDLSSLNISGLIDGYNFNQMTDDILKNTVAQIFQAMGNRSYYEGLASTPTNVDIGNAITGATLGGATSLLEWYATEYASHAQGDMVLKGSMIQLASNHGISSEVLSQYFNEDGEVIIEKFDEFIALISKKEFEEKMAIPKEQTIDLINQVKDALIEARQKEIDDLASSFEAIAEANNKMVDAIQDWVAEDRQRRKNEETEQSIADKQSQLAYLNMDTSGNNLETLRLEEEISKAEQDYQDNLIDQSIQKLQDANEIAQAQRDNQISLLQSQLDFWKESDQIWGEVNTIIVNSQSAITDSGEIGNTELGQLLNSFSGNLSPEEREDFANSLIELLDGYTKYNAYATGGLADFTGPAWLDGTKSRPEYVLNADQTERFFTLVDVLEGFDSKSDTTEKGGDNYFDIKINVDKLENDYDIEQMANKIRRMIYEDATYRNVNTINLIR